MKIYTKTGDSGETNLFGGQRITKSHQRIGAYGSIDELNAHIGNIRALLTSSYNTTNGAFNNANNHHTGTSVLSPTKYDQYLEHIQQTLFVIGSHLATPYNATNGTQLKLPTLSNTAVTELEQWIDDMEQQLTPLQRFILPGGTPAAAATHVARTVCRRAERHVVQLHHNEAVDPTILKYLNRLSDTLFVLARILNKQSNILEVEWDTGKQ